MLQEVGEDRGPLPDRVVAPPIQAWSFGGARGTDRSLCGERRPDGSQRAEDDGFPGGVQSGLGLASLSRDPYTDCPAAASG